MNTEYIDIQFSFPAFLELTPMIIFLPPPGSRQMHPAFNFISTNSFLGGEFVRKPQFYFSLLVKSVQKFHFCKKFRSLTLTGSWGLLH